MSNEPQQDNRSEITKRLESVAGKCVKSLYRISDKGLVLTPADIRTVFEATVKELGTLYFMGLPGGKEDKDVGHTG